MGNCKELVKVEDFDFHGSLVRVVVDSDGDPWFIAKDVAEQLGYSNTRKAVRDHCKAAMPVGGTNRSPFDPQTVIIPERDVYRLIMRSKTPKAEEFEEWVVGEVLPSIRKTGGYSLKPMTTLEMIQMMLETEQARIKAEQERDNAIATKAEIGHRREATAMNTASQAVKRANKLEQQLDQSQEYCTIKRMSMIYHGMKFDWRLLKSTAAEMGIDSIDVFDSNYGSVKSYHKDVWFEAYRIQF